MPLDDLPAELNLNNEHVILHVNLKAIKKKGTTYSETALSLIKLVQNQQPASIIIPTFTYSFTKTHLFNLFDTPSEVGKFSEEIRLFHDKEFRTRDPIFSVIDILNFGFQTSEWNEDAFGKNSIWQFWNDKNGIIINIGLDTIVSTQIHYIEKQSKVPYRENILIQGTAVDTVAKSKTTEFESDINYQYFARNLDINAKWDRPKILSVLKRHNTVKEYDWNNSNLRCFRAKNIRNILQPIMEKEPNELLLYPSNA